MTITSIRSMLQHVFDGLRAVSASEPRDPDHFAGPGFQQQEPELMTELGHVARL